MRIWNLLKILGVASLGAALSWIGLGPGLGLGSSQRAAPPLPRSHPPSLSAPTRPPRQELPSGLAAVEFRLGEIPARRSLLDVSFRRGFLASPLTLTLHQLSLRLRPWAGTFLWEALSVEATALTTVPMQAFSYKLGVSAELVELASGEPHPLQMHVGGGVTSLRPAVPVLPTIAPYVGIDARYELADSVWAYAGVDYVPTGFNPLQPSVTSFIVPNLTVIWAL